MGAQEQEPTEGMLPHRNANKQAEIGVFALSPAPPPGANQWTGSLFGCCTDCDSDAQSSCVLSYFVPCVAFGLNMKRALNLWAWCQAVIFLVLFLVVRWFYLWSYTSVMLYCSPSSPVGVQHTADLAQHQYQYASTAECQQAQAGLRAVYLLMVILAVIGTVYAARRRTQIREKFGIAGGQMEDFCSWFWCAPCALCQETRTIFSNNVHDGVWQGRTPLVAAAPAYTVPEVENMRTDYRPVYAQDLV